MRDVRPNHYNGSEHQVAFGRLALRLDEAMKECIARHGLGGPEVVHACRARYAEAHHEVGLGFLLRSQGRMGGNIENLGGGK